MRVAFYISLIGMALLFVTLCKLEMTAKNTSRAAQGAAPQARRRRRRRPRAPQPRPRRLELMSDKLPDNGGYVAAAYLVFLALAADLRGDHGDALSRLERELAELDERSSTRPHAAPRRARPSGSP